MTVVIEEEDFLPAEVDILEVGMDVQENMIQTDHMVDVIVMNQEVEVVQEVVQEDQEEPPDLEVVIDIQQRTGMVEVKDQREDIVTDLNDMKEEVDMRNDIKKKKMVLMIVMQEVVKEENEGNGMKKSMKNLEKEDLHSAVEVVLEEAILHVVEEISEVLIVGDLNVEAHVVDLQVVVVSAEVVGIVVALADVEEVTEEDILVVMTDMKELPEKAIETGMVLVSDEVEVKTDMEVGNDFRDTEMKMEVAIVEEELVEVDLHQEEEDVRVEGFQAEEDPLVVDDLSVKTIKIKMF